MAEDGPRDGIGEVAVIVRVEGHSGIPVLDLRSTFPDCDLPRDVHSLLPLISEIPFEDSA